jgi:hypothetical protein
MLVGRSIDIKKVIELPFALRLIRMPLRSLLGVLPLTGMPIEESCRCIFRVQGSCLLLCGLFLDGLSGLCIPGIGVVVTVDGRVVAAG